jgi:hypothetical protein
MTNIPRDTNSNPVAVVVNVHDVNPLPQNRAEKDDIAESIALWVLCGIFMIIGGVLGGVIATPVTVKIGGVLVVCGFWGLLYQSTYLIFRLILYIFAR